MDIQVGDQHKENIMRLMEICGVDMNEAHKLYVTAGQDFQKAVEAYFNKGSPQNYQQHSEPKQKATKQNFYVPEDFDDLYDRYLAHKQSGSSFLDKYQIRRTQGFMKSLVPSFLKGGQESQFKTKLEQFIGKSCILKLPLNSLTETIELSGYKQKFPIIVHVLSFQGTEREKIAALYRDQRLVDMFNVQFRNYGIDPKGYELERDLQPFINPITDSNKLIVLRVNVFEQIELLDRIDLLQQSTKQIQSKLKMIKTICINKEMDEVHIEKRYQSELAGNYNYQKPISIAEKRKIAEDRAIKKKQEQQFYASMEIDKQKHKQIEEQFQKIPPTQNTNDNKAQSVADIKVRRQKLRESLPKYEDGMLIKLRCPSGESKTLHVSPSEKGKYLNDYIESAQEDLGFENDSQRNFTIIRPYDKLNISENLEKSLSEIFEGSDMQSLIVSQI